MASNLKYHYLYITKLNLFIHMKNDKLVKYVKTSIKEFLYENKLNQSNLWFHGTDEIFVKPKYINSGREIGFHLGSYEQALNIKNNITNNYPKYINKYEIVNINPLRMRDLRFWTPEYIADELNKKNINVERSGKGMLGYKYYTMDDILDALKSNGYDSIIYKNEFEGDGDSIIIFDDKNIKFLGREKTKKN